MKRVIPAGLVPPNRGRLLLDRAPALAPRDPCDGPIDPTKKHSRQRHKGIDGAATTLHKTPERATRGPNLAPVPAHITVAASEAKRRRPPHPARSSPPAVCSPHDRGTRAPRIRALRSRPSRRAASRVAVSRGAS